MISLRAIFVLLALAIGTLFSTPQTHANSVGAAPAARAAADLLFDRSVELLPKDPASAKALFARTAAQYEHLSTVTTDQSTRASLFYNAGAARQLAGDNGRAILNFRRAQLLAPITPGLSERLAAARAEATGATTPTTASAPAANSYQWLLDFARSVPRSIRWTFFACSYVVFWTMLLVRIVARSAGSSLRPHALLLWIPGIICLLSIPTIATLWYTDSLARQDIVILSETIARSEPDDRIGVPAATSPFKPGRELHILEERSGGDGQPWLRISESLFAEADSAPAWIPASVAARVLDHSAPVLDAR